MANTVKCSFHLHIKKIFTDKNITKIKLYHSKIIMVKKGFIVTLR